MARALPNYSTCLEDKVFLRSFIQGAIFLVASSIAIFSAVSYATVSASNHVTDIILSNVPPMNVRFLFVYGTFAQMAFLTAIVLWRPNRIPFALKAIALFLLIRAIFISLTHIAPFPIDPQKAAPFMNSVFYGGDLFFSGHTGLPFLGALVFWHIASLRYFYLASTLFFATVVLMGHYHYSIDVLAALFITYGIYHLAVFIFPRDFALLRSSEARSAATPIVNAGSKPVADLPASTGGGRVFAFRRARE